MDIGRLLEAHDIDQWGVAANEPLLPLAPALPRAVSLVARHDPAAMAGVESGPTRAYYEDYLRLNALLDTAALALVAALRAEGWQTQHIPSTVSEDGHEQVRDWGASGFFPHKTAATCAGLGWVGKTALFVSARFGPRVRLATVFTDADLAPGTPIAESRCGRCRRCADACPAGAGRDVRWQAGMPRDELYDEKACELWIDRYEDLGGVCGICLAVCPYGKPSGKDGAATAGARR